jgi:AcrR family transcriptional regulator
MAMIAKKAGVAAGTIYCDFESKDVLIDAVLWTMDLSE